MRLALDTQVTYARNVVQQLREVIGAELADAILAADQANDAGIAAQRERVAELKKRLEIKRLEIGDQCSRSLIVQSSISCRIAGQKIRLDRRRRWLGV